MTTESSVVVALREVRRLELDRQRREEEARKREQEEERTRAENAAQRASIQYGPGLAPYVNGQGWGAAPEGHPDPYATASVRRTAEVVPLAAQVYADSASVPAPPPGWLEDGVAFRPPPKQKSRFSAVLLTMVFCGGAAAAGYWKLSGEWRGTVNRLEAEQQQLEEQRNEAIAARSKGEQELRVRIAELQTKLAAANSKSAAAETALAAKEVEAGGPRAGGGPPPLPGNRFNRMGGRRGRGGFRAMPAGVKPINPTVKLNVGPGFDDKPTPRVAKKKALSDDPLQGLKL